MVKLEAEGRTGELGDGVLHSLFVKKLSERHVEIYSRWFSKLCIPTSQLINS